MENGEGEKSCKRKMKTPYQLTILEQTYARETYPSESLRAELSRRLNLTDRQLQMWFCHRRLKDRKDNPPRRPRERTDDPAAVMGQSDGEAGEAENNEVGSSSGSGHLIKGRGRKAVSRLPLSLQPPAVGGMGRMGVEVPLVKRYYEPPQSISERRAISFVESQLGEPLREDGPILGVEFDPLPPDAFGAPIAPISAQPKQVGRPYDSKLYERQDPKLSKAPSFLPNTGYVLGSGVKRKLPVGMAHPQNSNRALHEYQFLPEQPSVRSDAYERVSASHIYDSPVEPLAPRASSLSSGGPYFQGNDQMVMGYGYQTPASNVVLPQHGRQGHVFTSVSSEYEPIPHRNSFSSMGTDPHFASHQLMSVETPFVPSDRRVHHDEDSSRVERKRKSEEARMLKEVEAHEKRIRKEIERQDILRRKEEEQMRRQMERHEREKRKEGERLMREMQREKERSQREQRRELERREKFLQKENRRAEKMRLKEEQRREKEAARQKAANERATARRIARESMELIEDERLELMELAASNKGLPSILSIDSETLQNLDSFKDVLPVFPPLSIQLKKPFEVKPWTDSEGNVGSLLMVWRFLITFTDVLELWPFTLDEFVQALHDYDPRLLGEIHISLLKSIIKDIEDVARTPSVGLGANQNSAANPGGGHPQIVEGAYAWGFNIRSWQHHLSPATWPEILRQLALSAGFGPQLKKRSAERVYFRDENEGHDGEDIISTLRNGAAAENAVALMHEKGYTHQRRSRHRLTPGTVKFAAFYVLSLEGGKGLTILEVADKIQKSGLRDLTTSKTPEASIAAALSRDSLLFERTAPSTYCVRAPYRKDPADSEAILAAAREKVQIFQNGLSDSEEAEKDTEFADDVDREEDSECDGAEDPEVDDAVQGADPNKKIRTSHIEASPQNEKREAFGKGPSSSPVGGSNGASTSHAGNSQAVDAVENFQEESHTDLEGAEIDESNAGEPWVQGLMEGEYSDLTVEERLNALVALVGVAIEGNSIRVVLEERLEAANCLKKQIWAEAQLDKRRMKEEFTSRTPYSSYYKNDTSVGGGIAEGGGQSPLLGVDGRANDLSLTPLSKQEPLTDPLIVNNYQANMSGPDLGLENVQIQQYGYVAAERSRSQLKSYISYKAEEMYVYRSLPLGQDRRRNRYWQFVTSSKNDPGSGRIFFESQDGFWRLIDTVEAFDALLSSLDTRGIRESHLHSMLQRVETIFKETISKKTSQAATQKLVDIKGAAETSSFDCSVDSDSPESTICGVNADALEKSDSFRIEFGGNEKEQKNALKRYHDMQKWFWKECFNPSVICAMKYGKKRSSELLGICMTCNITYLCDDNHCPFCSQTLEGSNFDLNFSERMIYSEEKRRKMRAEKVNLYSANSAPTRIELLKAQLASIEASIPAEALRPYWTETYRKIWGSKLHTTISAEAIFQLLTQLEFAINPDYLSTNYETTKELLGTCTQGFGAEDISLPLETVPVLPWVPATTAAVALRIMEFDASMSYMLQQKLDSQKEREAGEFIKMPSTRYAVGKNMQELDITEASGRFDYLQPDRWADPGMGYGSILSRGRGGGRGRGRGRSRGGRGRRPEFSRVLASGNDKRTQAQVRRGRSRGRGRRRGRRTVRKRQQRFGSRAAPKEVVVDTFFEKASNSMKIDVQESPRSSGGGEEWEEESGRVYVEEGGDNDNGGGIYDSDENGQASVDDEYEDDDQGADDYAVSYNGKMNVLMNDSEEDVDVDGDGNGDEDEEGEGDEGAYDGGEGDEDEDGDDDGDEDGLDDMDEDIEGNELDDGEGNMDEDEGTASMSSEYSDQ